MGRFAFEAAGAGNDIKKDAARLAVQMTPEEAERALHKLTVDTMVPLLGAVFTQRTTERIPVPAHLPPAPNRRVLRTNSGEPLPL